MTPLAHAALVLAVVLGVVLFRLFPGRRVVFGVYVFGVLFLPEIQGVAAVEGMPRPLDLPGFKLTKLNAIAVGLLAGSLLYDRRRWAAVRPRWFDLPALLWCVGPVVTSVANSLLYGDPVSRFGPDYLPPSAGPVGRLAVWLEHTDLYDGLVRAIEGTLAWGVSYWLGRVYVTDGEALRELLLWAVAGAAAYVPLCLAEAALSPQLHRWLYGFHQHEFQQTVRASGYRPMVFMQHGLAVGMWMVVGALVAGWLWWAGPLREVRVPRFGLRVGGLAVVLPLAATAAACRSAGALTLGCVGLVVLALARRLGLSLPVLALLCAAPVYVALRTEGSWDARATVAAAVGDLSPDRAASLDFRLRNEDALVAKALERPVVGWGGWGRAGVYDEDGKRATVSDGLWVITLGERGALGLVSLGLLLLLPVARLLAGRGSRPWTDPAWAPAGVAAVVLGLYAVDCLMNGMVNPVFVLLAAGLTAVAAPAAAGPPPAARPTPPPGGWRVKGGRGARRVAALPAPGRVPVRRGLP